MAKKAVGKKSAPKKSAPRAKSAKAAAKVAKPRSFMWDLLKRKEAEREQRRLDFKAGHVPSVKPGHFQGIGPKVQRYSRFAGPRRRAA